MPLTFEPFRQWFAQQKDGSRPKRKTDLYSECGFSSNTCGKIWNDRFPVRSEVIEKLCQVYGLRIEQVIEYREDETKCDTK